VESLPTYGDLSIFLQTGGRPPSWIHLTQIAWTNYEKYLVVFIVVQSLVAIDAAVSITWNFYSFRVWLENGY